MERSQLLLTIAMAVVLGALGQGIASWTRIPAIVFLLALGLASGPSGLDLVQPQTLGAGLPVLTAIFVAIILFEGGLTLRPDVLRHAARPVYRLITIGALVTLGAAAALAHYILGLAWSHALLFASLIVVTGPTVIAPILRRVRLQPRIFAVLKSESILIDPVGALVAIVVLQYVIGLQDQPAHWTDAVAGLFGRAGLGLCIGAALALTLVVIGRWSLLHRAENDYLINLAALGLVLSAYALAEHLYPESGIMAVTVAGLVLAAAPIPFRAELERFKEHLTTLGVSVLFILLAAGIPWQVLQQLGWREALLVIGVMLVVRPLSVVISTMGTELNWREKAYISLLAPRGIVAAAMAGHFAHELGPHDSQAAAMIEMLVFLTIATTVFVQGAWADVVARLLGVRRQRPTGFLIIGVNEWSLAVAEALRQRKVAVALLDRGPEKAELARSRGFEAYEGDATEPATYEALDLSELGWLVALTPNDAVNTLTCEAAQPWFEPEAVLQIVAKPGDTAGVRIAGTRAMPTALSHAAVCAGLQSGELQISAVEPRERHSLAVPMLCVRGSEVRLASSLLAKGDLVIGLAEAPTSVAA